MEVWAVSQLKVRVILIMSLLWGLLPLLASGDFEWRWKHKSKFCAPLWRGLR